MNLPPRQTALWLLSAALLSPAAARPLITEDPATMGAKMFEGAIGVSQRIDKFGSPETDYTTTRMPFRMRYGANNRLDIGFQLLGYTHKIDRGGTEIKGSRPGLVSPEIKVAIMDNVSLFAIWHLKRRERDDQDLPIARGNDVEIRALAALPTAWPVTLNAGWLFRGTYDSSLGVRTVPKKPVTPGDVFEISGAVRVPLKLNVHLIGELAYYRVGTREVGGARIQGSDGDAADAYTGLGWAWKGWDITLLAGFGLLDESHTSFDLDRGAGDADIRFQTAYRFKARKPNP